MDFQSLFIVDLKNKNHYVSIFQTGYQQIFIFEELFMLHTYDVIVKIRSNTSRNLNT